MPDLAQILGLSRLGDAARESRILLGLTGTGPSAGSPFDNTGGGAAVGNPSMTRRGVYRLLTEPTAPDKYKIFPSAQTPNFTPAQEAEFQQGVRNTPWFTEFQKKFDEEPDLDSTDYNYRAAWAMGARPEFYAPDNSYHWQGAKKDANGVELSLKRKDHPTGWMEDYFQMTGGGDPSQPARLTPEQNARLQALLVERYGK